MKDILSFIYSTLENIQYFCSYDEGYYSITKNSILEYVEPFSYLSDNSLTFKNNVLYEVDLFIQNGILNENDQQIITINESHVKYIEYKKINTLNKKNILKNLEIIVENEKIFLESLEENDDELENDESKDDEVLKENPIPSKNMELFKKSTKSSNKTYFEVESETLDNVSYIINKNMTTCSCKSFEFCKSKPKTCKHIIMLKNEGYDIIEEEYFSDEVTEDSSEEEFEVIIPSETYSHKEYYINLSHTKCTCPSFKYSKLLPKTCKHLDKIKKNS